MRGLIAILDAAYGPDDGDAPSRAAAGCVLARAWDAAAPERELAIVRGQAAPYVPGQFYKRELPLLTAILAEAAAPLACVVIDGFVRLGPDGEPGLGAHLFDALGGRTPVVGVAKTSYRDAPAAEVMRGASRRPLYVTADGMAVEDAAARVSEMHGSGRIPTLLKRADRLAREALTGTRGA